ncbi:MAG: 4-hydroxy-tetrahydrodipicolinate synthase [Dysgonamonadaceae bacterium]|jgi:4-hydroxy-tetrahydrodipicolinate synthase|nr:4-hydroxy-tetrahydrodipicolinate synthase [Dysgonamonadaceae bacterium]
MKQINLKGMGVALVTPFESNRKIDYSALERIVDFQLQNETDYLVILGTTAETPALDPEEQKEIIRRVTAQVKGKVPLVLGCGGNDTRSVVRKLETGDFTGIDAILSVVPYYNKPSQEGIYRHYRQIVYASPLPVILYNVPSRTGVNMSAETTLRIAREWDKVIAIKEASGNITQVSAILKDKPEDFQVVSGDDATTLPLIALGAEGVISVIGNAFPAEFGRMVRLALAGDYAPARDIHYRFTELFELLSVDGNPAGVKSVLNALGYIENELRLPLVPAQKATCERIRQALRRH